MTGATRWLRRLEIVLAIAGLSFLGGALAATVHRWAYQARQERAMFPAAETVVPPRSEEAAVPLPSADTAAPFRSPEAVDPLALGRIEIPRIGVRAIVREGDDDATLALAVGHVRGTARPGEHGNTVLAGHRDTFFRKLRNIRVKDRVRLDIPPHHYEYRVVSLDVVAPTETQVLDNTTDEELTLVTCYPFHYIGNAPDRFIVRAARIE